MSYTKRKSGNRNSRYITSALIINEKSNEYEIVDEDEKEALLLGLRFIRETIGEWEEQLPTDSELIEEFASRFDFLMK